MPPQPSPYSTTAPNQPFTPAQRSLQARNKPFDPPAAETDTFDQRQRKNQAVEILESTELLLWFSAARNESIAATRNYYQNILLSIDADDGEDVAWREEWEVPVEERVKGAAEAGAEGSPRRRDKERSTDLNKGKEKHGERGKGKKRVASA